MLNFERTPKEQELFDEFNKFFSQHVTEEKWDRTMDEQGCNNPYWPELHQAMAERGYYALMAPKEIGGRGLSFTEWTMYLESIGLNRAPFGNINAVLNTSNFLLGGMLLWATDEQKRKWIPKFISGEVKSCQGLTEPGCGADLAAVELRAVEQPDGNYILNGTKIFNNAHNATHILTVSRTDTTVAKHKGISLFLVDLKAPGMHVSPSYISTGGEKRSEVAFVDVRVPKENLLGEKNKGWYAISQAMRFERTQGLRIGEMQEQLDRLVKAVKELTYDGKPVAKIPWVRYAIAQMATEIKAVIQMCYWVAYCQDHDIEVTSHGAPLTKVFRTELQDRFGHIAIEIMGEYGGLEKWNNTRDNVPTHGLAAEWYQDSRKEEIGAGPTEVQLNIVSERGFGLPRLY
jgi:alkylation response protein AidB-like acyl-CoA dehydrogenase